MLAGHWELNVRSNNKIWTRLLVSLVLFIQSKFTKQTKHKQITIIHQRALINHIAEPFLLWLNFPINSLSALTPTDKAFGLGGKLFALLCPSFLLASQTADETGCCLHLVSAALSILQQSLMGRESRQSISAASPSVLPAVSTSIHPSTHQNLI